MARINGHKKTHRAGNRAREGSFHKTFLAGGVASTAGTSRPESMDIVGPVVQEQ